MPESLLRLPANVLLAQAGALWSQWQASLKAEAAGVAAAAGREVQISAAELSDFDSSVLSLLLGCARLCQQHGLALKVHAAPPALEDLARLYGVHELIWSPA
ncbi:phospholipid transport system transporter-binding protein [Inhella inkyongensis]|uniref:Phospholipid transport system transporter-binding protein n=1 Tax=Inhella inkyongensis TaxID=392593 RepID=A0A840S1M0_9BURK|nr:STAS domain-containing protein [Inhella inkyongensis]MBB5203318.1 phospholipid transport system transporter-binding protein [Inhella inkyongensis]